MLRFRPAVPKDVRDPIRKISQVNSLWGARPEQPCRPDSGCYASTSTDGAKCAQERKLLVLQLPQDPWARSHRYVATFRGRDDRRNWRPRTLLERPDGLFIKDRSAL